MNSFSDEEYNILKERLISYAVLEDLPEFTLKKLLKKFDNSPRQLAREKKWSDYKRFDNEINKYFNTLIKEIDKKKGLPYKITYSSISIHFGKSVNTIKNHIIKNSNLKYKYLKIQDKIKKQHS